MNISIKTQIEEKQTKVNNTPICILLKGALRGEKVKGKCKLFQYKVLSLTFKGWGPHKRSLIPEVCLQFYFWKL